MATWKCGDTLFWNGEPFGQVHYWDRIGDVKGASVHLVADLQPIGFVKPGNATAFQFTHVFVPEHNYGAFEVRNPPQFILSLPEHGLWYAKDHGWITAKAAATRYVTRGAAEERARAVTRGAVVEEVPG